MELPFSKHKNEDKHPVIKSENHLSFGQRASDSMTSFFGSWAFMIWFIVFIFVWMMFNLFAWVNHWDPYPFILLNLILSCISAMQAPVILMSQNRQTELDRVAAQYDYDVNKKAEAEIQDMQKDLNEIKALLKDLHREPEKYSLLHEHDENYAPLGDPLQEMRDYIDKDLQNE